MIFRHPDFTGLTLGAHPQAEGALVNVDDTGILAYKGYQFLAKEFSLIFQTWSKMEASERYRMRLSTGNVVGPVQFPENIAVHLQIKLTLDEWQPPLKT